MRKFHFKLQAFHDATRQRERSIRHDLVRAEGVEQRLRAQLSALLNNAAQWEERIRETQRGPLDHKKLREQIGALAMTQRQITRQQQALSQASHETEKIRRQLTEAARKRKSVERLREKNEEEYLDACAAADTRQADDIATTRAAGKRIDDSNDTLITGVSQ